MTTIYARCRRCGLAGIRGAIWMHQIDTGHRGIDSATEQQATDQNRPPGRAT